MPLLLRPDSEMTDKDYCITPEFAEKAKIPAWEWELQSNFSDTKPLSETFDDGVYQLKLAEFLSEKMEAPFYILERGTCYRKILNVVLLSEDDIETFQGKYPDWTYNPEAYETNLKLLGNRVKSEWEATPAVAAQVNRLLKLSL